MFPVIFVPGGDRKNGMAVPGRFPGLRLPDGRDRDPGRIYANPIPFSIYYFSNFNVLMIAIDGFEGAESNEINFISVIVVLVFEI